VPSLRRRALSRLVQDDSADPPRGRLAIAQAAAVPDGAHEAVVNGVEGSLLIARDRGRQPHERAELLAVDGLDRHELCIDLGAVPHTHMISGGRPDV
jgi:hypothetical protein